MHLDGYIVTVFGTWGGGGISKAGKLNGKLQVFRACWLSDRRFPGFARSLQTGTCPGTLAVNASESSLLSHLSFFLSIAPEPHPYSNPGEISHPSYTRVSHGSVHLRVGRMSQCRHSSLWQLHDNLLLQQGVPEGALEEAQAYLQRTECLSPIGIWCFRLDEIASRIAQQGKWPASRS